MKKSTIIFPLLSLALLASCSSSDPSSSKPSSPSESNPGISQPSTPSVPDSGETKTADEYFDEFLAQRRKGYFFEGTAKIFTTSGYDSYCIDVKVKQDGYEYIRYETVNNNPGNKDEVGFHYYYTYDPELSVPYVTEPVLGIDNQLDYSPSPIGDNGEAVKWKDSDYVNLFSSLTADDFLQQSNTFTLDVGESKVKTLLPKLAEQFIPKNPGRTIKALSFDFDEETKGFTFTLKFNSFSAYGDNSYDVTGKVSAGDGFTFNYSISPLQGEEDKDLKAAFDKLALSRYAFTDTYYVPDATASALVQSVSYQGQTDGNSLLLISDDGSRKNDFLYKSLGNNKIQQANGINGTYYAYQDPVSGSVKQLLPDFKRSTLFFDKQEDGTYVFNKKAGFSRTNIYNRTSEGKVVGERTIKLLENSVEFDVNYSYPQSKETLVYTYVEDSDFTSSIQIEDNCDNLTSSELLANSYGNLENVLALVGGKENFDLIPTLGGKNCVAGLYYSDGVDSEGEETKEKYYGIEYRVGANKALSAITAFESKLEAKGFVRNTKESGSHFSGDLYSIAIQVSGESKKLVLEVGYSDAYGTLAIALSVE